MPELDQFLEVDCLDEAQVTTYLTECC